MPAIDLSILNQRQTPAFYADVFANRPAAGFVGRIFVSTNTFAFYRDNGTGWDLIGGPGTGTITGSGTAGTVPLWNGASTIGDSSLIEGSTKISTTKDIQADAVFLNGMTAGNGALYYTSDRVTLANYNPTGTVVIEVAGGSSAQLIAADLSTTFLGNIIRNGGTSSQFLKADGSLDSSAYVTTNIYNGNGTLSGERTVSLNGNNLIFDGGASVARVRLDADTNVARIFSFATNNLPRWAFRIDDAETGSSAGSNFSIRRYDDAGTFVDSPLLINRATGQSTFAKKVVIENNAGDQQLQIVSTTAPSLRIDNLQTGATKRVGIGLSTTVNNFIQGSVDRDFCVFNSSTTASPILFGIYDAGLTNTQEAARISPARNFLIGTTTDAGQKLQVNGIISSTSGLYVGTGTAGRNAFSQGDFRIGAPNDTNILNGIASNTSMTIKSDFYGGGSATPLILQSATNNNQLYLATNGNIGVNNNNPSYKFEVTGIVSSNTGFLINSGQYNNITEVPYTGIFMTGSSSPDGFGSLLISSRVDAARPIIFGTSSGTNSAERMRIAASTGNLLIGTTTDVGAKLQVNGNFIALGNAGSNGILSRETITSTAFGFFNSGIGTLVLTNSGVANVGSFDMTTGVYTPTSDRNKKKNFEQSNLGLEAILKLKPTLYNMISQSDHEAKELGFIAQEVKEVIEQAYVQNGEFIGLNYQPIVAALVKAIQDLNNKIENLKN